MTQKIQLIDENLLYYCEGNGKVVRVIDDEFHVVNHPKDSSRRLFISYDQLLVIDESKLVFNCMTSIRLVLFYTFLLSLILFRVNFYF